MEVGLNLSFLRLFTIFIIFTFVLKSSIGIEFETSSFTEEEDESKTEASTIDQNYEDCTISLPDGINLPWMASLEIRNQESDSTTNVWYRVVIIDPYILLASGTIFRSPKSNGKLMLETEQNYHIRLARKPGVTGPEVQGDAIAFDFASKNVSDCKDIWDLETKLSSDVSLEYKDKICGTPTVLSMNKERSGFSSKSLSEVDEKEDSGLCNNKPYYVIQTLGDTQRILIGIFNGIAQDMSHNLTAFVLTFNQKTLRWINNHKSCGPGNYTCDNGDCIPLLKHGRDSVICDDEVDCDDDSDENPKYCCSRVYLTGWVDRAECAGATPSLDRVWYVVLGVSLGLFIIGVSVQRLGRRMRKRRFYLTKAEILAFRQGIPGTNFAAGILKSEKLVAPCRSNGKPKENIQLTSMEMPYIYDIEKDKISFGTVIGSGEFGTVYKGTVASKPVAVKALKTETVDKEMFKTFLIELKILAYINYIKGGHPNVISLVGAYTNNIKNLELYIVVEYCHFGSIDDYLKENRKKFVPETALSTIDKQEQCVSANVYNMDWSLKELPEKSYMQADLLQTFSQKDLISWCLQIADGLSFLSSLKIIHGDLAARNILLDCNLTAKISDFGLSRQIYYYNCPAAKIDKKLKLPWRWLAPEVIENFKISNKSDVWSFGITMWEIYTLGAIPYGGLEWSPNFIEQLKCGVRLTKPEYATDEIFKLIQDCWKYTANDRPDFGILKAHLSKISMSM